MWKSGRDVTEASTFHAQNQVTRRPFRSRTSKITSQSQAPAYSFPNPLEWNRSQVVFVSGLAGWRRCMRREPHNCSAFNLVHQRPTKHSFLRKQDWTSDELHPGQYNCLSRFAIVWGAKVPVSMPGWADIFRRRRRGSQHTTSLKPPRSKQSAQPVALGAPAAINPEVERLSETRQGSNRKKQSAPSLGVSPWLNARGSPRWND